jgi:hypothetical protein
MWRSDPRSLWQQSTKNNIAPRHNHAAMCGVGDGIRGKTHTPLTVQPTDWAVPRISQHVPALRVVREHARIRTYTCNHKAEATRHSENTRY